MSKLKSKNFAKLFAVMIFVLASFVLSLSFALTFSSVAKADDANYYVINLTAQNGQATLSYEGNNYPELENIFVKESDGKYKILKSVVDDTNNICKVKVTAVANKNYEVKNIVVNEVALTEGSDNSFVISPETTETNVVVNFVAKKFHVKVTTSFSNDGENYVSDDTLLTNNMGVSLDALTVDAHASIFDETNNVVANDRESDHLEFVGYFIKNVNGVKVNVSALRNISNLVFDDDFIDAYLGDNDTLEIVAEYQYKRAISVAVDSSCAANGSFDVILRDRDNNVIDFTSGEYYSVGTKISVVPTAKKYYKFARFELNGEKKYDANVSLTVENRDIDLVLFFNQASYELSFNIVNSIYERLGNEEILTEITHVSGYYDTPVAKKVVIGDTINSIRFKNIFNYQNYRFLSWQLISNTGESVSVSSDENVNIVKNLQITNDFVDKYVKDGKIQFYGVFIQNCQLSIVMHKAYDTEETFEIYDDGVKVTDLSKSFDYGTILTITVPHIDHMTFDHFEGLIVNDQYTPGQTTAYIIMNGNRSISAVYEYVKTEVTISEDSSAENARLSLNLDKIKIGDTLIINAKLLNGYKLKKFTINNSSAKNFVKTLNSLGEATVANYGDNGIVTIFVNKDVYDYFTVNHELKIDVDSKINGTYVALFVIYILLAIGLGAVIVVLSIKTNNYNEEIKKLQRKKQEEILKKEEEQRKEEEKEKARQAALKAKAEAKENPVSEKPKKTQTKKTTTKSSAEKAKTGETKSATVKKKSAKPKTTSKKAAAVSITDKKETKTAEKKTTTKKTTKKAETKDIEGGKA